VSDSLPQRFNLSEARTSSPGTLDGRLASCSRGLTALRPPIDPPTRTVATIARVTRRIDGDLKGVAIRSPIAHRTSRQLDGPRARLDSPPHSSPPRRAASDQPTGKELGLRRISCTNGCRSGERSGVV
jgi:hypothetical protein